VTGIDEWYPAYSGWGRWYHPGSPHPPAHRIPLYPLRSKAFRARAGGTYS